jgi:hypothetical protein
MKEARMRPIRCAATLAATAMLLSVAFATAGATTVIRQGLDKLTAENESVLQGRVTGIHSYWNADHSFILTDVTLEPTASLKGALETEEVVLTLMGGTVGDLTTLIIGGPELVPGSEYLLFVNREDLPGAPARLTVRDLAQGVFDVVDTPAGRRAVSQAIQHPLLPDEQGLVDPPGGVEGMPVDELAREVRRHAGGR